MRCNREDFNSQHHLVASHTYTTTLYLTQCRRGCRIGNQLGAKERLLQLKLKLTTMPT